MRSIQRIAVGLALTGVACAAETSSKEKSPVIDDPRTATVSEKPIPINVCQLQATLVILPENVMRAFVADKNNWHIESGKDSVASRYLSITVAKPLTTTATLNVISDREKPYTFLLVLNSGHCDSKVTIEPDAQLEQSIQNTEPWLSPSAAKDLREKVADAEKATAAAKEGVQREADAFRASYPRTLKFDYKYDANIAERMGIRAIAHDDKFTYIWANSQETPTLLAKQEGTPSLINFNLDRGLYTHAGVLNDGYLAVGGTGNGKHQQRLDFHRVTEN